MPTNNTDITPKTGGPEAVEAFKAEFVKEGAIVLDAWFDGEFIVVYVDMLGFEVEEMAEKLQAVPAPGEYLGHPTMLTVFPREDE